MVVKKIPMRSCIACRESKPKKELIRIVKNKEGQFFLDKTGKLNGRGAYICDSKVCFDKMCKKRLLNQTFSMEVGEDIYNAIAEEFFGK